MEKHYGKINSYGETHIQRGQTKASPEEISVIPGLKNYKASQLNPVGEIRKGIYT